MTRTGVLVLAAMLATAGARPAQAQPATTGPRFVLSAGGVLFGSASAGERRAELRPNTVGTASPVVWFRTESALERAGGFDARVDVRLTRAFALAVGSTIARPRLAVAITGDSEAGPVDVSETVTQYTVDLSAVWRLPWGGRPRRVAPYVIGGAGYIRHLHEDRLRVDTGRTVHLGGGLFHALGAARLPWGVRADARWVRRTGGVGFDDRARHSVALSLLAYAAF